jgi:acid phosphatase type 7
MGRYPMKARRLFLFLALSFTCSLFYLSAGESARVGGHVFYPRLMWNNDASTTATIGWSSDADPSPDQIVYYDTVDFGEDISKYRQFHKPDAKNSSYGMFQSFARLKGLEPNTKYYFVIASSIAKSKRYWFETTSQRPQDRISLIAGGDSRNNRDPRRNANLLVSKLRAHAVLFGGDMTATGTIDQWREWLEDWQLTISADGRMTPVIITRGNHEVSNSILVNLFDTNAEVYYGVNIGGTLLRVYTLNSESSIAGEQTTWLEKDLKSNGDKIWKIAQYHRPIRPHVKGKVEGINQYKYWAPLFYMYGMNLVSEADAHTVKSTWPLKPSLEKGNDSGFVRDDKRGTVFIGEGCWGAPLRTNDDDKSWTRNSGKFNHFNWIFLDHHQMIIRTVIVDNAPEVSSLTNETRFEIPGGIQIWTPSNGDQIVLAQ